MTDASNPQVFSTEYLPPSDRIAIWREVFGRQIVQLDMEQLDEAPLHYAAEFRSFDRVGVGLGTVSSISCERSSSLVSDANDDIVILVPLDGAVQVAQRGQEALVEQGGALVRRSDDPGKTWSTDGAYLTLTMPEAQLSERLYDADRLTMTVLPKGTEALGLLTGYASLLARERIDHTDRTCRSVAEHLVDLTSLALGATRDNWVEAQGRGVRAARRRAVMAAIAEGATDLDLRPDDVARRVGISAGYMRKLLAEEQQSFSGLLMERRLALARDCLCDARQGKRLISDIAFACGFGDLSYFNRAFRKHYGATPSEVRAKQAE